MSPPKGNIRPPSTCVKYRSSKSLFDSFAGSNSAERVLLHEDRRRGRREKKVAFLTGEQRLTPSDLVRLGESHLLCGKG